MSIEGMYEEARERASNPEGMDLLLLTEDLSAAQALAPLMAERLHPDRRFGRLLAEEATDQGWVITIQDLGIKPRCTQGADPATRIR